MRVLSLISLMATLVFSGFTMAADSSQKYIQISNQKQTESDKVVIYEFFWYGCPHCYTLEPTINCLLYTSDAADE